MTNLARASFKAIRKRDGRLVSFDLGKITEAIFAAAKAVGGTKKELAKLLAEKVYFQLQSTYQPGQIFSVEDVQDVVEKVLIEEGHAATAKAYILYRAERNRARTAQLGIMDAIESSLQETDRENANVGNCFSAKLLKIAEIASKAYYLSRVLDQEVGDMHERGDIHIHDLAHYSTTLNCLQVPLGKLLAKGFNNGHGFIRSPKRPGSAGALAAIILQSSQNDMFGGQSYAFFDRDMAPYFEGVEEKECFQAMEAFIYNLNSMHSRAGAQVPFSSLNLGTDTTPAGRMVTKQVLLAFEKGLGRGENPIFPNIIFKLKHGVNFDPGDPNYDLFQLAMRVAARRLNPTFSFMDSSFNAPYGDQVGYMGCRTRVMGNLCGPEVTDGRGNLHFTTINLPRLALKTLRAGEGIESFEAQLRKVMAKVIAQLLHRTDLQGRQKVKDLPFVMGQELYLDSEKLSEEDPIAPVLRQGTISVGFIGLAETLVALVGKHHGESAEAQELGTSIVSLMREICDEAAELYGLNITLIATPAEGLSGRFTKLDQKEFGVVPGVTDREYYTNSFHVPVHYTISAYEKIRIEGPYHKFTNAGHISYVEFSAPPLNNLNAVETLLRHMSECDFGYAGINFPVDFCEGCGYTGLVQDECPSCGATQIRRVRRITGYLSTEERFNSGKAAELHDRIGHISCER
ncbi:anaerobic ribonucleoside-triphosphate reductase [Anaeromusa acidaminophila]|uniref:anaerobic ribonucleoside-triphosphate reductase n=1 Tax=Anaeromusa acidaminophila TaxID=81464 RepID=UPI000361B8A1|nr:anaerobic ribonucleoside-triphosphate reductase [Anaeromusa acidaminophila]